MTRLRGFVSCVSTARRVFTRFFCLNPQLVAKTLQLHLTVHHGGY